MYGCYECIVLCTYDANSIYRLTKLHFNILASLLLFKNFRSNYVDCIACLKSLKPHDLSLVLVEFYDVPSFIISFYIFFYWHCLFSAWSASGQRIFIFIWVDLGSKDWNCRKSRIEVLDPSKQSFWPRSNILYIKKVLGSWQIKQVLGKGRKSLTGGWACLY